MTSFLHIITIFFSKKGRRDYPYGITLSKIQSKQVQNEIMYYYRKLANKLKLVLFQENSPKLVLFMVNHKVILSIGKLTKYCIIHNKFFLLFMPSGCRSLNFFSFTKHRKYT